MKIVRTLLGLFLAAAVCVGATDVFAAAPPGGKDARKHHHKSIHGVVVEVDHDKGGKRKGPHGLIKVRVHEHGKGKGKAGEANGKEAHVVTVHVNATTRFEFKSTGGKGKGKGGKGGVKETLAHFRDVHPGMHVRIKIDHGHHAEEVDLLPEGKGGKGKGKK